MKRRKIRSFLSVRRSVCCPSWAASPLDFVEQEDAKIWTTTTLTNSDDLEAVPKGTITTTVIGP